MRRRSFDHSLRRLVAQGFALLVGFCGASVDCRAVPPPGYYLVWSDEFNSTNLDRSKWDYWLPGPRRNAVNVPNAISLDGSNLVITTYTSNKVHYTGFLATDETFRSRYGYWESRIRWGDTNGMWSAFWLQSPEMVERTPDPRLSGSEIDIAEHRFLDKDAKNIANQIQVNIHWNGYGRGARSSGSGNVGTGLADEFHTYGFLSTPNSYSFRVDDSKIYGGGSAPISHSAEWVIFSSEVDDTSTTWAGHIPAEGYGGIGESVTKMTVDYVRYYAPSNVLFWTGAASANWSEAGNWIAAKPPLANSELTFTYLSTNTETILDHDYAVNQIVVLPTKHDVSINGKSIMRLGSGGIDLSAANRALTISAPVSVTASQTWFVGPKAGALKLTGAVSGKDRLTKSGLGTLILDTPNDFNLPLNVESGMVSLGDTIKRLAITGGLTLSSNSTIALKIDAARNTCDELKIAGAILLRGDLTVSNVSGELKEGASFKLFEAQRFSGAFEHFTLPTLPANLAWNTQALTNGLLSVILSSSQP